MCSCTCVCVCVFVCVCVCVCVRQSRDFPCAANEGNTAFIECVALGRRPLAPKTQTTVERWKDDGKNNLRGSQGERERERDTDRKSEREEKRQMHGQTFALVSIPK